MSALLFQVQDLAVASPATVSRCGMVYLEPSILGILPFVECWLKKLPDNIYPYKEKLQSLFDIFLEVCCMHSQFVLNHSIVLCYICSLLILLMFELYLCNSGSFSSSSE